MKQIKKIAITNEKGGVGKTMTAVNLSACLAQRGYRVLLIDADPQGYATLNYDVAVSPSLLEVLRGQVACTKAVQTTRFGVDVLPSDRTLSVIEEDLIRQKMNGAPYLNTLEKALEDLPDYDFVIIDCPPQGGRLMDIVHYYADAIIMPMFAEDYGIHALTLKAEAIADIRRTINPNLKILGGLITMDERRGLRSVFREVLLGQDLLPMFSTTIRRNVALIRAVNQANASREYTPQRKLQLYEEYRELLEEMKEAGEIKGGMQEHLAKLMGVSERSVRYYKQMSEQLTPEEKDDVAEGRLDVKEARERAVERGRETGNIVGSGEKEEKSEKSEKPKQDKLEQAILKVLKLADKEDPEKVTALLNRYLRGYMG